MFWSNTLSSPLRINSWITPVCTCLTRLSQLVEKAEFAEIIKEDAASVERRHETDSVPLVDEIRYHIASNVQTYSEIEEANQKLEALEELLSSININC